MTDAKRRAILNHDGLQALIEALRKRGYRVVGPRVRDGAVVYDDISGVSDLPAGWTDEQDGGHYRLRRRDDNALFGYAVGPHSWKRFLHPPVVQLWKARKTDDGMQVMKQGETRERFAFIGVRACELHAIAIQDRVFLQGAFTDPHYKSHRDGAFLVAVNCGQAGGTCFCTSMGTGPGAESGFDLSLTELLGEDGHRFLVETGSDAGEELLDELPHENARPRDVQLGEEVVARTARSMGREMDAERVPQLLARNLEHARWDEVAQRCLTCANCTMVCPTCFCTSVEDHTDLAGEEAVRERRWDSCFTMDFSYIHGGSVRNSPKSRYRQWMTHKLSTWVDQFGTSGCVGCGRCITWCPVGIDITEEVRAIADSEKERHSGTTEPAAAGGGSSRTQ